MPDRTNTLEGSAAVQADLWGERARDWADVLEGLERLGDPPLPACPRARAGR